MVDQPADGEGYLSGRLSVDSAAGVLAMTTTPGIQYSDVHTLDNALGVPAGTGGHKQAGLWFGVGENDYVRVVVMSTPTGTVV